MKEWSNSKIKFHKGKKKIRPKKIDKMKNGKIIKWQNKKIQESKM